MEEDHRPTYGGMRDYVNRRNRERTYFDSAEWARSKLEPVPQAPATTLVIPRRRSRQDSLLETEPFVPSSL